MKTTIKDIAREAGVSYQTVSKALRGTGSVNEVTAQKIKKIARDIGYIPSIAARAMTTRKSQLIAIFLPQIASSFYHTILQGIENLANEHDYSVLLYLFHNTSLENKLETILSYQVEGIIIFENHFSIRLLSRFHANNIPILFVNSTDIPSDANQIAIDACYGLQLAFAHLAELGHRHVLFALSDHEAGMKRIGALQETIPRDYGMKLTSKVYCDYYSSDHVFRNFNVRDVQHGITAIVCTSDYIALPIMTRLQEQGICVPEEMSLVGFDDLEFSAFLNPPLTTIRQPKRELGEKIFQTLFGLMRGEARQSMMIFPELIVRGTTKMLTPK